MHRWFNWWRLSLSRVAHGVSVAVRSTAGALVSAIARVARLVSTGSLGDLRHPIVVWAGGFAVIIGGVLGVALAAPGVDQRSAALAAMASLMWAAIRWLVMRLSARHAHAEDPAGLRGAVSLGLVAYAFAVTPELRFLAWAASAAITAAALIRLGRQRGEVTRVSRARVGRTGARGRRRLDRARRGAGRPHHPGLERRLLDPARARLGEHHAGEHEHRADPLHRDQLLAENDAGQRDGEQRLERGDDRGLRRAEPANPLQVEHDRDERRDDHDRGEQHPRSRLPRRRGERGDRVRHALEQRRDARGVVTNANTTDTTAAPMAAMPKV